MRALLTRILKSGAAPNGADLPRLALPSGGEPAKDTNGASASAVPNYLWEWTLTSEQIGHEAEMNQLIPMLMPRDLTPHPAALILWLAWQKHRGWRSDPGQLDWLPVGRVGPILLLGHFNPRHPEARCPVPVGYFQPVLLLPQTYRTYYQRCAEIMAELTANPPPEISSMVLPVAEFPNVAVTCDSATHALTFLRDHYLLPARDRHKIYELLARPSINWVDLPVGYHAASAFLCRSGPVADLTLWQVANTADALVPTSMRKQARPLSEVPGYLWLGVQEYLPQSALDEINYHLPETRRIFQVLFDTDSGRPATSTRSAMGFGQVSKVIQQGAAAQKEEVTLVLDRAVERIDPRKATTQPRDIFRWLLLRAVRLRGSDLHIEPLLRGGLARVRVDGFLQELFECSEDTLLHVVGAAKEISGMGPENFNTQDKQFSLRVPMEDGKDEFYTVRVAAAPVRGRSHGLVLRFLPKGGKIIKLDQLQQPPHIFRALRHAVNQPQGMMLVCGPTGHGKTTTIASALDAVNSEDSKLITIEDPIEYELERVMQMQVDKRRSVGFEALLRETVRLDPDVALVGEIRDEETADSAVRLSLTGHLVFATLHTLSSAKAVPRLVNLGVDPDMLAESLLLILSQRLYPCLCPHCRQSYVPSDVETRLLTHHKLTRPEHLWRKSPNGCVECQGRGVRGRVAAMEIIRVTSDVSEVVARGARALDIEAVARKQGDLPLLVEAMRHALSGRIALSEALSAQAAWAEGWDRD